MSNLKVVIVGTMFSHKTIHGPFDDDEHMNQWIAIHAVNQLYEIVPLLTHDITIRSLVRDETPADDHRRFP